MTNDSDITRPGTVLKIRSDLCGADLEGDWDDHLIVLRTEETENRSPLVYYWNQQKRQQRVTYAEALTYWIQERGLVVLTETCVELSAGSEESESTAAPISVQLEGEWPARLENVLDLAGLGDPMPLSAAVVCLLKQAIRDCEAEFEERARLASYGDDDDILF